MAKKVTNSRATSRGNTKSRTAAGSRKPAGAARSSTKSESAGKSSSTAAPKRLKFGSLLNSATVRKVAAAGLATAAAALLYRKSTANDGRRDTPLREEGSTPKDTAKAAKRAIGKRTPASATTSADVTASEPTGPVRRKRSDAGVKRGRKKPAALSQPEAFAEVVASSGRTETSALALGLGTSSEASIDETAEAEAHPS